MTPPPNPRPPENAPAAAPRGDDRPAPAMPAATRAHGLDVRTLRIRTRHRQHLSRRVRALDPQSVKIQAQLLLGDCRLPSSTSPITTSSSSTPVPAKIARPYAEKSFERKQPHAGVTDRLVAVHCDLGRIEWSGTRELAQRQAAHYGIPFAVVRRTGGDLLDYVATRGKWPSSTAPYCTSDFNVDPDPRFMTTLAERLPRRAHSGEGKAFAGRPCRILNCMGHRGDESPARAKTAPFRLDHANARRIVYTWLPPHLDPR